MSVTSQSKFAWQFAISARARVVATVAPVLGAWGLGEWWAPRALWNRCEGRRVDGYLESRTDDLSVGNSILICNSALQR